MNALLVLFKFTLWARGARAIRKLMGIELGGHSKWEVIPSSLPHVLLALTIKMAQNTQPYDSSDGKRENRLHWWQR